MITARRPRLRMEERPSDGDSPVVLLLVLTMVLSADGSVLWLGCSGFVIRFLEVKEGHEVCVSHHIRSLQSLGITR